MYECFYFGGNPQEDLSASFVGNNRFINYSNYEFGKMFLARITRLVKFNKNVTEQLTSKRRFDSFGLWTNEHISIASSSSLSEYMQFCVCVRKHNIMQFIY